MNQQQLLNEDPPACRLTESSSPILIVCDHASRYMPERFDNLGLSDYDSRQHVAWDIGAAEVSMRLATSLGAGLIMSNYSRLLIDPNRYPGHAESILVESEGVRVPGNIDLPEEEKQARYRLFFEPYHTALRSAINRITDRGSTPVVISIHSFTPVFQGHQRPWHVGLLWRQQLRLSTEVLSHLRSFEELNIGDNQPYNAQEHFGYTIPEHAEKRDFPHLLFEIRQDLISDLPGVDRYSNILHEVIFKSIGNTNIDTRSVKAHE